MYVDVQAVLVSEDRLDDINGACTGTCKAVCTSTGRNTFPVTSHLHSCCANARTSWRQRCEQGHNDGGGEYIEYLYILPKSVQVIFCGKK